MKIIANFLVLVSVVFTISFRQNDNHFIPKTLNGFNYLCATTISVKNVREFERIISLNNINRTGLIEQQSDTNDILTAEQILKTDLDSFLLSKIKTNDTTVYSYKQRADSFKNTYNYLKKHTRQIKSFTSQNKKYMYINLFCEYSTHKVLSDIQYKSWVQAHDGGECFWQIIVNLTDKQIVDVHENGLS